LVKNSFWNALFETFLNWKFLKFSQENSEIYLEKVKKLLKSGSVEAEILHENALLVSTYNCILSKSYPEFSWKNVKKNLSQSG
jgi:hypothetical protein